MDRAGACEPACVRSPDGKQLLLLIRDESREANSLMATSDDEGETWSPPRELPLALTGDRFLPRDTPDGRLVIVFRPVPSQLHSVVSVQFTKDEIDAVKTRPRAAADRSAAPPR